MSDKLRSIINNIVYILIGNTVYGLALYFFVTGLADDSLLLAYFGNLGFIFCIILLDEYGIRRSMRPEYLYMQFMSIKTEKNRKKWLRFIHWSLTHYMSFKTFLFVFYIGVLIFAQIIKFYPSIVGQDVTNFINIIDYSVIILLAFKDFGEEITKDRSRTRTRLEEFNQYLAEHQGVEASDK